MTKPDRKLRLPSRVAATAETVSKPLVALSYARYSSSKQNDKSCADQHRLNRQAAERAGYDIVGEFNDNALSGRTLLRSRPGVSALLDFVAREKVDAIFVEGIERIGRRAADVGSVCSRFEGLGIDLFTPGGKLEWKLIPFLSAIGEFQSREIGEKTYRGGVGATKRGRVAAGIGFGYRTKNSDVCNREIDEISASVVVRIFEEFAAGISPYKIAASLNSDGIPSPTGGLWGDSTIRGCAKKQTGILRNTAYVGIIRYGRNKWSYDEHGRRRSRPGGDERLIEVEAPQLQIVSDDLWNRVHDRLANIRKSAATLNGSHRPRYLLAGLLRCGSCGGAFSIVDRSYGCFQRKSRGHSVCDNARRISRADLEQAVFDQLREPLDDPALADLFASEVARAVAETAQGKSADRMKLERQLAEAEKSIARLLDLLEQGGSSSLLGRLRDRESEAEKLRQILSIGVAKHGSKTDVPHDILAAYRESIERIERLLGDGDQATLIEANTRLKGLIDHVEIGPGPVDDIVVVFRQP